MNGLEAPPPVGLYVHVPFCLSLCPYCEFVVYAGGASRGPANRIEAFVAALMTELELRADALDRTFGPPDRGRRRRLETVYFGGGTPSLLKARVISDVVGRVRGRYGLADNAEITLEANPGPGERGDAAALAGAGVNRISFGAQSFQAAELTRLGRRHSAGDVAEAVAEARAAGIGSIGLDLLYDVPGQTIASWADSLGQALALAPDHLSLYALTLGDPDGEGLTGPFGDHLPTAAGAMRWRVRARQGQDDDRAVTMYQHATSRLASAGWHGYEISNWARPGHESRHNLAYWEGRPYEAVGPGAHAFDGATRRWNAARLDRYLAALTPSDGGTPSLPPGGSDRLDDRTASAERVMLALRTDRGIPVGALARPPLSGVAEWAAPFGLLSIGDERVRLTTKGRLLSNELFARLL